MKLLATLVKSFKSAAIVSSVTSLSCAVFVSHAVADTHVSPLMGFELYKRTQPEAVHGVRLGVGIDIATSFFLKNLDLELGAFTVSSTDTFSTQDSLTQKSYRIKGGFAYKFLDQSSFFLSAKAGAQYWMVTNTFFTKITGYTNIVKPRYWVPYVGIEAAVLPVSGFGVRQGISFLYDKNLNGWVSQFYFAISLL